MVQNSELMKDEHAVFLAETDEQLRLLEEGLMELEQKSCSPELGQTLFRAAHILKGLRGYWATNAWWI